MAIQHIDGFDWIRDGGQTKSAMELAQYYWIGPAIAGDTNFLSGSTPAVGRFGYGKALRVAAQTFDDKTTMARVCPDPQQEMIAGISARMLTEAQAYEQPQGFGVAFMDMFTGKRFGSVNFGQRGLVWVEGPTGAVLAYSAVGSHEVGAWFNMQARFKVSELSGEVEVQINKKTVILATSLNTAIAGRPEVIDGCGPCVTQRNNGSGYTAELDDFFFLDTVNGVHKTFIDNARVKLQAVISDGSNIDSTIGGTDPAPTHWESVNNQLFDDSKYVYTPTVGDFDFYGIDPNLNNGVIYALQARAVARQDDATQRTLRVRLKSTTSIIAGTVEYLNQSYTHYYAVAETDPDTGVAWLPSQANVNQVGYLVDS